MSEPIRTLLMEGERQNLLADATAIGAALRSVAESVDYTTASALGEAPTWTLSSEAFAGGRLVLPVPSRSDSCDYTLSLYAWVESESPGAVIELILRDADEGARRSFLLSTVPTRMVASHRFGSAPTNLVPSIALTAPGAVSSRVMIAFPVLEAALFASSPIPPADVRRAETLHWPRAPGFFEGAQGTLTVAFHTDWSGHELAPDARPCVLACADGAGRNAVVFFANGARGGRLTVQIVREGARAVVESPVVPQAGEVQAMTLRWVGGLADFLVNGWPVASMWGVPFPAAEKLGERVFVGSWPQGRDSGLFGGILSIRSIAEWQSDLAVQADLFTDNPGAFRQFRSSAQRAEERELARFGQEAAYDEIAVTLLRYPDLWQSHPPPWLSEDSATHEATFRDEIVRALGGAGINAVPEAASAQGRTDALVRHLDCRFRIEFKVWGRHDYAAVPEKPLKYVTGTEYAAAVLMINPRKGIRIGAEYRRNVLESPTRCVAIVDRPYGDSMCDHFVSVHAGADGEVEVLHVVFDRFGPFPGAADAAAGVVAAGTT